MRLHFLVGLLLIASLMHPATRIDADEMKIFRIGTGGIGGTYYPVGGLIAQAISNPPGSRACQDGGSCGVPGLIAVAQSSNGSVANVNAIRGNLLESGFVQSDVAYWAATATGIFSGESRAGNLRAIANLYQESVHLVARKDSAINSVHDLRGKRVSLDEPGSGTLVGARIILRSYGLIEADLEPEYTKPTLASEKMRAGELDAFFIVAGYPTSSVQSLAESGDIKLIPIDANIRNSILLAFPFFSQDRIPYDAYPKLTAVETIGVNALWVVSSNEDEKLVYDITKALWNDNTRKILERGHPKGAQITRENALKGIGIPLHPGAKRFYDETRTAN